MKRLAIIPARKGSKRLPLKNIKPFYGKPIMQYSINAALQSGLFDEVMVSTDDEEFAEIAKSFGATIPFLRSKENANDTAILADVVIEVIQHYRKQGQEFDAICMLLPTAPFISGERLSEAYDVLNEGNFDSVTTLIPYAVPIQTAFKLSGNKKVEMMHPEIYGMRTQDMETTYYDAGQFYWMRPESVERRRKISCDNTGAIILSEFEAHDIDTEEDWNLAELKYKYLENKGLLKK